MSSEDPTVVELHGRQPCHYRLANPWNQPLGRIAEFLVPILLDPQTYRLEREARLLSSNLVGVARNRRIVEETLHHMEIKPRLRRSLRLRSLLPAQERLRGAVCSLVDSRQWTGSFYHWFLDGLPRLIAAEDHSERSGEPTRVIVPATLTAWQRDSLALLGLPADRMISHRRVGQGGLAVERLIAYVAYRWQRLGGAPFDTASPWAIRRLADRLSQATPLPGLPPPRRLYLSRRGVATRQVANEDALLALLEPHGFVAVQSEQLSLSEQITLFRGASHIVAPHGASLTNLLHCGTARVLELFQENHGVRPDFFQLAMIKDLDYRHTVCPVTGPGGAVTVDLSQVAEYLEQCL